VSLIDKPPKPKPSPAESDLSQILSHAMTCRQAYGLWFGTLIMLVALSKTRTGAVGLFAAGSLVVPIIRQQFLK
jgi:hypothetical protein